MWTGIVSKQYKLALQARHDSDLFKKFLHLGTFFKFKSHCYEEEY